MTCVSHFASTNEIYGLKCNLASCEDQKCKFKKLSLLKEESSSMRGKREKKREKRKERKEKEGKKKRVRQGGARWDVIFFSFELSK